MATKALRETTVEQIGAFVPLQEAGPFGLNREQRVARVILITEGLGNLRDKNFYTREAIQSCPRVFEGKQFYVDHPSRDEEETRPERSIRDLAGYFKNCSVGTIRDPKTGEPLSACFADLKFSESDAGNLAMAQVATALEYQRQMRGGKDVYAGISINAGGLSEPGVIDGTDVNMVRQIHDAFSADIVTKPARGGKFLSLVQEAARSAAWARSQAWGQREGKGMNEKLMKALFTEAEQVRIKALGDKEQAAAKDKTKDKTKALTEAETAELTAFRAKYQEAKTARDTKVAGLREALRLTQEALTAEGVEGEGEAHEGDDAPMGEGAEGAEGETHEADDDPMAGMEKMAEGILGKIKRFRQGAAGEGAEAVPDAVGDPAAGDDGGGGGEEIGPVDAGDPQALVDDIMQDLAALAEFIGGGAEEPEPGMEPEPAPVGDAGAGEEAMNYKCTACGSENEVLPPKGYKLAMMGEADRGAGDGTALSTVLREHRDALRRKLEAKEERFAVRNIETRKLVEKATELEKENTQLKREKEAGKLLREAKIPGDILSVAELMKADPSMWGFMLKTAKGRQTMEARLTEAMPAGTGTFVGAGRGGDGSADAVKAFDAAYEKP